MTLIILTTIFGSVLGRLLNLHFTLEFEPNKLKDIFNIRILFVCIIEIFLGLILMFLQKSGTNNMNIVTAFEVGVAAPFIFRKLVEKLRGQ